MAQTQGQEWIEEFTEADSAKTEKRRAQDGEMYTRSEFLEHYGSYHGECIWQERSASVDAGLVAAVFFAGALAIAVSFSASELLHSESPLERA